MQPSPPLPTPSAIFTTAEAPPLRQLQLPTNMNSDDSWNDPPLPKLRLMCSYGGHIVPRPHDKSLCYIGGDTRMIVIDRHTSISDLHHRLSKTLLNNQPFTLKYQLPNEDLDSLISVSSDEDLECMVEEYDRLNNRNSGLKISGRLRLFLFPKSSSLEHLLLETSSTKSGDWFLNAVLNGKDGNLSTAVSDLGFSDSSSINYLLGLDNDFGGNNIESQLEGSKNCSNHSAKQDVLETSSSFVSFGSTSSSPSVANLPPIKVENQKLGVEDRFQEMNIGVVGGFTLQQRQESDGYLAEQAAQQQMQVPFELYSPESVSREGSATNPSSRQRQTLYQQQCVQIQSVNSRVSANQSDRKTGDQESGFIFSGQFEFDQNHHPPLHQTQQFGHADAQYNHAGGTPVTSYYPPMHSSQQQHNSYYPVYFLPARPTQATYNMPVQQPNYRESAPAAAMNSSYAYEFADPTRSQVYYTQHFPRQLASHIKP